MAVLDRFRLDGKCILVTGGSRGFGRAIALAAAEAGADVMLVARDPAAPAEGGAIDILVNNVGGRNVDVAIENSDLATWQQFIDLNLTHCFICTKMIGGALLARGDGRVINIASISGMIANRGIGGRHYETGEGGDRKSTR